MNIGEAAAQSGVPAKTIRYYEEIGLIQPARRADNGYRAYRETDVHMLRFVQRARSLGFSVRDCRQLLQLYQDPHRASADVKALAERRVAEIDRKMARAAQHAHHLGPAGRELSWRRPPRMSDPRGSGILM